MVSMLFGTSLGNGTIRVTPQTTNPTSDAFTVNFKTLLVRVGGGTRIIGGMSPGVTVPQFWTIPGTWPIPTTPTTRTGTTPVNTNIILLVINL